MNAHTILSVHRRAQAVYVFPSAQAMIDALRGPQQADWHLKTRAAHFYYVDQAKRLAVVDAVMREYVGLPTREVRA